MKIGFIGTGAIAEAVVTGLCGPGAFQDKIVLTRRSAERSERLVSRFKNVHAVVHAQELVDQVDWIFLSVLPEQAISALTPLVFRPDQVVLSAVADLSVAQILDQIGPAKRAHRIIPMPPIEQGYGPVPIFPFREDVAAFFEPVGTPIRIENEEQIATLSTGSSFMATFYEMEATIATWMENRGLDPETAASYTESLFHALSSHSVGLSAAELKELGSECCTAGGLNEQVLRENRETDWFASLQERLERIWKRLHSAR